MPDDVAVAKEHVAAWADGRIMHADLAYELGMVDAVGYRDAALDMLREKAGSPNGQVFRYAQVESLGGGLLGLGPRSVSSCTGLAEEPRTLPMAARNPSVNGSDLYVAVIRRR